MEEAKKKEKTFNSLIEKSQNLIDTEVAAQRQGFREIYGIQGDELPEEMDFDEQLTLVTRPLIANKNKLTNANKDTPKRITRELQNNKNQISNDGVTFLERVLSAIENNCSEEDLINSIKSVKDKIGNIDLRKAASFITTLAWGYCSINEVIKEVKKIPNKHSVKV